MATINVTTNDDTYYHGSAPFFSGPNDTSTTLAFGGWGDIYHSYLKFDNIPSDLRSDQVSQVLLYIYVGGPSVNDPVAHVRRVTSSWDGTTLTRINLPTEDATNRGSCPALNSSGWKATDITQLVKDWIDGTSPNYGLKIHSTVGSNQNNGNYDSKENSSGNAPYLEITLVDDAYTRGYKASVPTDYNPLSVVYSSGDKTNVSTNNAVRVAAGATGSNGVLLHLYKFRHTNNTDQITVDWDGQASTAPSSKQVKLQIYNFNTPAWEDLDSDNATAANTDFALSGVISTNISNYYDSNNYVYVRVHQDL